MAAAPMLTSINAASHTHLIVGISSLTTTRCTQSLAAGAHPILIAPPPPSLSPSPSPSPPTQAATVAPTPPAPVSASAHDALPQSLRDKITAGLVTWHQTSFDQTHLLSLGRPQVDGVVDAVFVTLPPREAHAAQRISAMCQRLRIPVNVVDEPQLCTFSLLSVHTDGPLQIGITTNGRGCRLAARIRREIAGLLPPGLGDACERLGGLRKRIQQEDCATAEGGDLEDSLGQGSLFNGLVRERPQGHVEEEENEEEKERMRTRRGRWLAQMCEYWPLKRLAGITDENIEALLSAYPGGGAGASSTHSGGNTPVQGHQADELDVPASPPATENNTLGRLILAGSGPGHPDLLTCATLKAIHTADLILADKLVPSPVLDLIPRRTPVHIARKFPGNADLAQQELLETALTGLRAGQTVLRLKQGDPYIYGRGGEEVLFFQARGLGSRVSVLPGVTSALSGTLFAGIPATQRDVADQVLICTGTGKKGKPPRPPPYVPSQTVVFLMALHRIADLVDELTTHTCDSPSASSSSSSSSSSLSSSASPSSPSACSSPSSSQVVSSSPSSSPSRASSQSTSALASPPSASVYGIIPRSPRVLFPSHTPCAVIERASCPDQRVIRTTLEYVAQAIEAEGSRPPGLLVVGHACHVLSRHHLQLGPRPPWVVEEGFRGMDTTAETEAWTVGLQAAMGGLSV
ncbi:hypothetical protein E4U60_003125 [Claviceps pazoutovae]|uniref:precorrin-2 dehydrogenase n=1 Tax=Claviceps pazoutovae TaxID=1649127 RepID=A0A9P7MAR3_9HYPO|nr:hypothetical protein E4U60_003125 [Claviceps pazoutovae]